jgi:UDP-GlcNAc3NAcA epimerase
VKVLTVIGNRPQFIKAAAVSPLLRAQHTERLVHTGQHHDDALSAVFFSELGVPSPDLELGIAGGTNSSQTARMLAALGPVVAESGADAVLVYGDTNSTLAGALAGAQAGMDVAHVEAGMRSFDRSMPEELNRVLADHAATLLLCSSQTAVENLANENVSAAVELVGDVMVDLALKVQPRARARTDLVQRNGVEPQRYVLVTAHRAGNVDHPARLEKLVSLLRALPLDVVMPLHPRTRQRLERSGQLSLLADAPHIKLTDPLGYLELTSLLCNAHTLLTDSGGLQKEAYLARVPCITLRASTEWVETVNLGWNVLVDLDAEAALGALERRVPAEHPPLYGDGRAAERVVGSLTLHCE